MFRSALLAADGVLAAGPARQVRCGAHALMCLLRGERAQYCSPSCAQFCAPLCAQFCALSCAGIARCFARDVFCAATRIVLRRHAHSFTRCFALVSRACRAPVSRANIVHRFARPTAHSFMRPSRTILCAVLCACRALVSRACRAPVLRADIVHSFARLTAHHFMRSFARVSRACRAPVWWAAQRARSRAEGPLSRRGPALAQMSAAH